MMFPSEHEFRRLREKGSVVRNDEVTMDGVMNSGAKKIVLSLGA